MSFNITLTAEQTCSSKVQCDRKSTKTDLQPRHRRTGASVNATWTRSSAACTTRTPQPRSCCTASFARCRSRASQRSAFCLKSSRCVSLLTCASLRVPSRAWCGLSALWSDSQTHSHFALPLGAVWACNKFCIFAAASINEPSANQKARRKLPGRNKRF